MVAEEVVEHALAGKLAIMVFVKQQQLALVITLVAEELKLAE